MSTKKKCINCGLLIDNDLDKCPYCGYIQSQTGDFIIEHPTSFSEIDQEEETTPQTKKNYFKFHNGQQIRLAKQIALFIVGFAGISILATIISLIFSAAFSEFATSIKGLLLVNTIVYSIGLITVLSIANKDLPKLFKGFKKGRTYLMGISYGILLIVGTSLISRLGYLIYPAGGDNQNESSIVSCMVTNPGVSLLIFGLLGPIVEEFAYRLGFFGAIAKKSIVLAYIATAILFGLIHANFLGEDVDIINELVQLPNYMFAGILFSFVYDKEGIETSITTHVFNNLISLLLTLLVSNAK